MCPNGHYNKTPESCRSLGVLCHSQMTNLRASYQLLTLSFLLTSQPLFNLLHLRNCRDSAAAFDAQACHCVADPAKLNHLRPGRCSGEVSSCR